MKPHLRLALILFIAFLGGIVFYLMHHRTAPPVPDGIISPAETQAVLLEQLQQAEPGSEEARRLAHLIRTVRDKAAQR
ncbi:MAG TPA: hypothetical protein VKP65_07210, partial [Rhodothermales bacterium]|nr:hypothetical protein [Rhodothermales bacterium]